MWIAGVHCATFWSFFRIHGKISCALLAVSFLNMRVALPAVYAPAALGICGLPQRAESMAAPYTPVNLSTSRAGMQRKKGHLKTGQRCTPGAADSRLTALQEDPTHLT